MRKIDVRAMVVALVLGAGWISGHAQNAQASSAPADATIGVRSSIETVDQLLKRENEELLAKSRPASASPSGPVVRAAAPVVPALSVDRIYGTADSLKADVSVNGEAQRGLRVGSKVSGCTVTAIAGKCVALAPLTRGAKNYCTAVCWTGLPGIDAQTLGIRSTAGSPGQPMPAPLPLGVLGSAQPAR